MEENRSASIFRGVRGTQAVIMSNLLLSFFAENKGPKTAKFKFNG